MFTKQVGEKVRAALAQEHADAEEKLLKDEKKRQEERKNNIQKEKEYKEKIQGLKQSVGQSQYSFQNCKF